MLDLSASPCRRGRPRLFDRRTRICFVLDAEDAERIAKIAAETNQSISSVIRGLILKALSDEHEKLEKEDLPAGPQIRS